MASCSLEGLARFRSLRWYTGVLEGVGAWHGAVRLEIIRQQSQHLLASLPCAGAHTSDAIGDPRRVWSPSAGILAAPQTLLYAAVLSDLEQLCGDLSGFRVVEIGGGYGGQLKVATDFFALSQYVMVDLAEALDLQQRFRFLAHCGSEPSPMGGGRGPGRRGCGWRKRPGDLQLRVARVHAAGARLVLGRSAGQGATRLHPQQQPLDGTPRSPQTGIGSPRAKPASTPSGATASKLDALGRRSQADARAPSHRETLRQLYIHLCAGLHLLKLKGDRSVWPCKGHVAADVGGREVRGRALVDCRIGSSTRESAGGERGKGAGG
eukprot:466934-Rhodomonas_salina.1